MNIFTSTRHGSVSAPPRAWVGALILTACGSVWAADPAASAAPGSPLHPIENAYWKLTRLQGRPVTVGLDRPEAHLRFDVAAGRVSGNSGCNQVSGTFRISGRQLTLGPLISTRMACAPDLMRQERQFFQALEQVQRSQIQGDRLQLQDATGQTVAEMVSVLMR